MKAATKGNVGIAVEKEIFNKIALNKQVTKSRIEILAVVDGNEGYL